MVLLSKKKIKRNLLIEDDIYDRFHKKDRIILFSDAVFAIILTLLIIEVISPLKEIPKTADNKTLWLFLYSSGGQIIAYLLSYLFIINLWFGHNQLFGIIEKVDNRILWINNLLLLNISFTPFPIAIISDHPHFLGGIVLFGLTAILNPLLYMWVFNYAYRNKLLYLNIDLKKAFSLKKRFLLLSPISAIPLLVAFFNTTASIILYITISVIGLVLSSKVNLLLKEAK